MTRWPCLRNLDTVQSNDCDNVVRRPTSVSPETMSPYDVCITNNMSSNNCGGAVSWRLSHHVPANVFVGKAKKRWPAKWARKMPGNWKAHLQPGTRRWLGWAIGGIPRVFFALSRSHREWCHCDRASFLRCKTCVTVSLSTCRVSQL